MLDDVVVVHEGTFAFGPVVVDIVVEGLPQEVEAVQVVESFDVGGEAAAVFGVDLYLVGFQTGAYGLVDWESETSVWDGSASVEILFWYLYLQFTPRDSHAASVSGPAGPRNSFVFIKEPLNRTLWYSTSTSAEIGAVLVSRVHFFSNVENLHHF